MSAEAVSVIKLKKSGFIFPAGKCNHEALLKSYKFLVKPAEKFLRKMLRLLFFGLDLIDLVERVRAKHHQRKGGDNQKIAELIDGVRIFK